MLRWIQNGAQDSQDKKGGMLRIGVFMLMRKYVRKRVLMVVQNCPFLVDTRVSFESYILQNAGFRVSVISPIGMRRDRKIFENHRGISIYRFPLITLGRGVFSYIVEYLSSYVFISFYCLLIFCSRGFDIIHFANPPDFFFPIGFLCRLLGRKIIFDQHDLSPEVFTAKYGESRSRGVVYKLLVLFEKMSYLMSDRVIVTNESYRDIAINRGSVSPEDIAVVRNGRDAKCLGDLKIVPELKKDKQALVTYMGVISSQDGVDCFLKAIAHIIHNLKRQDTQFAVIGDGSELDTLKRLAVRLDIMEYVTFTGWLTGEAFHAYLSTTDIGISPEPHNSLNNVSTLLKILDYMSYGKPIVAFNLKETRNSAGPAAMYATPNDIEDFAAKIVYLLDNPGLQKRLGETGYQRIIERFAWRYSKEKLLSFYSNLAGIRE